MHGDLSSENIWLDDDDNAILSGFGIHQLRKQTINSISNQETSKELDIFNMAIVFWEVMTGKLL